MAAICPDHRGAVAADWVWCRVSPSLLGVGTGRGYAPSHEFIFITFHLCGALWAVFFTVYIPIFVCHFCAREGITDK